MNKTLLSTVVLCLAATAANAQNPIIRDQFTADPTAVKYIFEGCGSKENPDGINKSVADLKAAGFNAEGLISEGTAHEFLTWRRCLRQMALSLFK